MAEGRPLQELVEQARSGDRAAFAALTQALRLELLEYAGARMGEVVRAQAEAEDIVQETFLKAYEGLDRFEWRGDNSLRSWLRAIAEHLIRNLSRKRGGAMQPLTLDRSTAGPSPSRIVRRDERFGRLQGAFSALSPDHRKVIELARLEGLTTEAIAARMQRSPGAVKKLLSRALEQLKEGFGDTASLHLPDRPLAADTSDGPEPIQ
jgi:RNA polymerase sigma-70 factor (ECF subfamily)